MILLITVAGYVKLHTRYLSMFSQGIFSVTFSIRLAAIWYFTFSSYSMLFVVFFVLVYGWVLDPCFFGIFGYLFGVISFFHLSRWIGFLFFWSCLIWFFLYCFLSAELWTYLIVLLSSCFAFVLLSVVFTRHLSLMVVDRIFSSCLIVIFL